MPNDNKSREVASRRDNEGGLTSEDGTLALGLLQSLSSGRESFFPIIRESRRLGRLIDIAASNLAAEITNINYLMTTKVNPVAAIYDYKGNKFGKEETVPAALSGSLFKESDLPKVIIQILDKLRNYLKSSADYAKNEQILPQSLLEGIYNFYQVGNTWRLEITAASRLCPHIFLVVTPSKEHSDRWQLEIKMTDTISNALELHAQEEKQAGLRKLIDNLKEPLDVQIQQLMDGELILEEGQGEWVTLHDNFHALVLAEGINLAELKVAVDDDIDNGNGRDCILGADLSNNGSTLIVERIDGSRVVYSSAKSKQGYLDINFRVEVNLERMKAAINDNYDYLLSILRSELPKFRTGAITDHNLIAKTALTTIEIDTGVRDRFSKAEIILWLEKFEKDLINEYRGNQLKDDLLEYIDALIQSSEEDGSQTDQSTSLPNSETSPDETARQ